MIIFGKFGIINDFLDLLPKFKFYLDFVVAIFVGKWEFVNFDGEIADFDGVFVKKIGEITLEFLKDVDEAKDEEHRDYINNNQQERYSLLLHKSIGSSQPQPNILTCANNKEVRFKIF